MPIHRVFLVHGMGHHPPGWSKKISGLLGDLYEKYEKLADRPIEARIKFHEINYDNIFRDLADTWATKSAALRALLGAGGNPLLINVLDELSEASKTDGNFIWSHAADVVLYRLAGEVRMAIRASVARQFAEGIQEDLNERQECQFTVVAHSLGTAVAHDSLHALMTGTEAVRGGHSFSPPNIRATLFMQVANVSRVVETAPDVYQSSYQPGAFDAAGLHGANFFFNCRHILDPFPVLRKFEPMGWPTDYFREIEVRHVHEANVHGFEHYLVNPAVHIPFRAVTNDLAGFRRIRKSDEAKAIEEFKDLTFGPALDLAKQLNRLPFAKADTWEKMSEVGKWFGEILERF